MNKSLTIVLPVYNAESHLHKNVIHLLELASELTTRFSLLVIDDGSTDATPEVANQLAAQYPQVSMRRHRVRCGLGAAIEYAERHVRSDAVIVHDGVTPIDPQQMRTAWHEWLGRANGDVNLAARQHGLGELAELAAMHRHMEDAHRRVLGFQAITAAQGTLPLEDESPTIKVGQARTDAAHFPTRAGVGQIPSLPRPKFLSALARFAWGE